VKDAGGQPVLIAPQAGTIQAFNHLDTADTFPVDQTTARADVAQFDGVVLPGGVANPINSGSTATPSTSCADSSTRPSRWP